MGIANNARQTRLIVTTLAAAGLGLGWLFWDSGPGERDTLPEAAEASTFKSQLMNQNEEQSQVPLIQGESIAEASERMTLPQAADEAKAGQQPKEKEAGKFRYVVRGSMLNSAGRLLSGVRIACERYETEVLSDELGSFELELQLPRQKRAFNLKILVSLEGYVGRVINSKVEGPSLDLGEVLLHAAGSVLGRVLDQNGAGQKHAMLLATAMGQAEFITRDRKPSNPLGETKCDANGYFQLDGLPVGDVRLWAGAPGMLWSTQDGVRIVAGQVVRDVVLELEVYADEQAIEMLVLDPDGNPVANANIRYQYRSAGMSGTGSHSTDSKGAHRHMLATETPHDFSASDPDKLFRPAVMRGVKPGTLDLVLQLLEAEVLEVLVQGPDGQDLAEFSVQPRMLLKGVSFGGESASKKAGDPEPGRISMQLPPESFELQVSAPGHQIATLGPFESGQVGPSITVSLERLAGVFGIILEASGAPVSGAKVSLHKLVAADSSLVVNGFKCRSMRGGAGRADSDGEGNFEITLRDSGSFYLRAKKDGLAVGEAGPFELASDVATRDLHVVIGPGGIIEGRVLLPAGQSSAGQIVGFSRADGFGFTVRADDAGVFRAEHLTPGQWLVEGRGAELSMGSMVSSSGGPPSGSIQWSCEVWAGRTTNFDLNLE